MAVSPNIGILGGTFDPVHFAHLRLGEEVAERFSLDSIHLVPSANPPHRNAPLASAKARLDMVNLALTGAGARLRADDRELNRIGKSYMVDTLIDIRSEYPGASISLILGADAFMELTTWYKWRQLFSLAHIIVASRPNTTLQRLGDNLTNELRSEFEERNCADNELLQSSTHGLIFTYEFTPLEISGTLLRERIRNRLSLKYLLPDNVIDYIQQYDLYKGNRSDSITK